ncbi:hypothetical protein ABG067_007965, partial [Albugo candida]
RGKSYGGSHLKVATPLQNKNPLNGAGGVASDASKSSVNFIDSAASIKVFDQSVNNVKRRRNVLDVGGADAGDSIGVGVMAGAGAGAGVSTGVGAGIGVGGSSSTVAVNGEGVINKVKKKKTRRPVKHLNVSVYQHNVLDMLKNVNAGVSILDWLTVDKKALNDLSDAIRTLKARNKKTKINNDGTVTYFADRKGKSRMNTINAVNNWDDGYITSETETSSSASSMNSDDENESNYSSSSNSSEMLSVLSKVKYPYDLEAMRRSAPLKCPIAVNNYVVDCTIDSGASVSVMNEGLARKLGLKFSGDQMHLVGFDSNNVKRAPCNISKDVPVVIGGHLRAEHVCIQPSEAGKEEEDYFILGMPFCKEYSVTVDCASNIISFPVEYGTGVVNDNDKHIKVMVQGYSTHDVAVADFDNAKSTNKVFMVQVAK